MADIALYDIVLFVHVTAVVVGFGATFAYPFFQVGIERASPRSVPALLHAMHATSRYLVVPGSVLVLASGLYLTVERWAFGEVFVLVGLAVAIGLILLGALYFEPLERRLITLAERDTARAGDGTLSEEYVTLSKRFARVGAAASMLVLVAVFFMTAKP